ncbi:MAG: hypothetical protein WAL59_28755 [Roseiarcus sp.]
MVRVDDEATTILDREIDPKTARKIRKSLALGLDPIGPDDAAKLALLDAWRQLGITAQG